MGRYLLIPYLACEFLLIVAGVSLAGGFAVFLWFLLTFIGGALVLRLAMQRWASGRMLEGPDPVASARNTALALLSGLMLMLPGILSDSVGLALLIPGLRSFAGRTLGPRVMAGMPRRTGSLGAMGGVFEELRRRQAATGGASRKERQPPGEEGDQEVIEGEFRVLD